MLNLHLQLHNQVHQENVRLHQEFADMAMQDHLRMADNANTSSEAFRKEYEETKSWIEAIEAEIKSKSL